MGLKNRVGTLLNSILRRYGYQIYRSDLLCDGQRFRRTESIYKESTLPEGAEDYLQPNNPRLIALEKRYAEFNSQVTAPLQWEKGYVTSEDIRYFRGDNAYVWQLSGDHMGIVNYILTTYYVKSIDKLNILEKLKEDDYFGIFTFLVDNKKISRDLLDSIIEIYFLDKHLNVSSQKGVTLLDIGAGYGRLAHRMVTALPNIQSYMCTDAVAISTFICEYYLRFRKLENCRSIPLDEIEKTLENQAVDIGINIYSFGECSIQAIEWWLSLLAKQRVKHLMIVPNLTINQGEIILTNDGHDMRQIIEKYGYKLLVKEPKYKDPLVQEYGIMPAYYYIFEFY